MADTPKDRDELVEVMARAAGWTSHISCCHTSRFVQKGKCNCGFMASGEVVLAALEAAGVVCVPREATDEMCANVNDDVLHADQADGVWQDMLSVSPYRSNP